MPDNSYEEVISFTPAGQVLTFRDMSHAKAILMTQYHKYIVANVNELAAKHSMEDLHRIMTRTLKLELHDKNTRNLMKIPDKHNLAIKLWPMLLVSGRRTTSLVFQSNIKKETSPGFVVYRSTYIPGADETRDVLYITLPPQARVLVDMFVERIQPLGMAGVPEYSFNAFVNETASQGYLKTKQKPLHIWAYYSKMLQAKGFIEIIYPRQNK